MNWLRKKTSPVLVWLGFGIVLAVLPILILAAMKFLDSDWRTAEKEVRNILEQGELYLILVAIFADSMGRLLQDIVRREPARLVGLKVFIAVLLGGLASTCSMDYVKVFSNLHAHPAQPVNSHGVLISSWIFLALAFVFGLVIILMVNGYSDVADFFVEGWLASLDIWTKIALVLGVIGLFPSAWYIVARTREEMQSRRDGAQPNLDAKRAAQPKARFAD